MSINLSDIAILKMKDSYYRCIISLISKNDAMNLMKNADLTEKSRTYKNVENYTLKNINAFESLDKTGKNNHKIW